MISFFYMWLLKNRNYLIKFFYFPFKHSTFRMMSSVQCKNVIQEKIQWKHPWNIISFSSSNVEEILCWGSPKRVMGKRKLLWNIPAVALNHHSKNIWSTVSVKTYFQTSIDHNSNSWLACMFGVQPIISRLLTVFQSNKAISMSKMHSWIWSRLYCLFCQD